MVFATAPMPRSKLPSILLGFVLLAAACTGGDDPRIGGGASPPGSATTPPPEGRFERVACGIPHEWLVRIWNGYHPERSGEIQTLARRPNFIGAGLPHAAPWDVVTDVPLFWYGPGHIPAVGRIDRPVTSADIAPTIGRLVGFDFEAPDGEPMREVLGEGGPPKLVVMIVWDGAGRPVLAEWEDAWPNLRELIPQGAWYDDANVGSSPASSAQIHATFGTGAFPRSHGASGHHLRVDGEIVKAWRTGPGIILLPTVGDEYDKARGNEPLVAGLGTVAIQLGMLGHGAEWPGGDRDLVVLRETGTAEGVGAEALFWNLPDHLQDVYEFPEYINDLPPLESYFPAADRIDGTADGRWRGHDFEELKEGLNTPARIPYQNRLVEEVVEREGFGKDDVPDLLFINYKLIDEIGHAFSMNSVEMRDSVEIQDEELPVLIDILDRHVGEGNWVLLVTADHGSMPSPEVTGAFQIGQAKIGDAIQQAFDTDDDDVRVVDLVKQTEIFINTDELEENGFTLEDVSALVMDLRQKDVPIEGLPMPNPNQRVFQAAFPSEIMADLPCLPEA